MSFCFLYNVVLENHSVQNSPWGEGGLLPAQGLDDLIGERTLRIVREIKIDQELTNLLLFSRTSFSYRY